MNYNPFKVDHSSEYSLDDISHVLQLQSVFVQAHSSDRDVRRESTSAVISLLQECDRLKKLYGDIYPVVKL